MKWDAAEVLERFPDDGMERLRGARRPFVRRAKASGGVGPENVVDGDFRERVQMPGDGRLGSEFAADLGRALAGKGIFRRAGKPCYLGLGGKLSVLDGDTFRGVLEEWVVCEGWTGRGENRRLEPMTMGLDMANFVLKQPGFLSQLRDIRRVVPIPLPVREGDRVVLPGKGYHAETRVMVEECDGGLMDMEMDVSDALSMLDGLQREFPYARGKERQMFSNQLATMLGVYCDLLLEPGLPRPAFVYLSNAEGSGKTLLVRLAVCPVWGPLEVRPAPEAMGDELRKVLTTEVVAGSPYLCFDNFRTGSMISSPALESFITASVWSDRWMGKMEKVSAPRDALVFLSGNNCQTAADLRRRCLFVEMFLEDVESERRKISNQMSESSILRDRWKILSALWAIVRYWNEMGQPGSKVGHGSYREWGDIVGGMVECLGLPSPLNPVLMERGGDTDLVDMNRLVSEVWRRGPDKGDDDLGSAPNIKAEPDGAVSVKTAFLMDLSREMGLFPKVLAEDEPTGAALNKERNIFGRIIRRFENRVQLGGLMFQASKHASRANRRYQIFPAKESK